MDCADCAFLGVGAAVFGVCANVPSGANGEGPRSKWVYLVVVARFIETVGCDSRLGWRGNLRWRVGGPRGDATRRRFLGFALHRVAFGCGCG